MECATRKWVKRFPWGKGIKERLVSSTAEHVPREELAELLSGGFASVDVSSRAPFTLKRNAFSPNTSPATPVSAAAAKQQH